MFFLENVSNSSIPSPWRPLVTSFNSRNVNLSWTPPTQMMSGPDTRVSQYVVLVRRGENTSWEDSMEVDTNTSDTTFTVHHLQPFTVYSFKVLVHFSSGLRSESSESYYMITLREVPSGSPTITVAHNISSNAIYLVGFLDLSKFPPKYQSFRKKQAEKYKNREMKYDV